MRVRPREDRERLFEIIGYYAGPGEVEAPPHLREWAASKPTIVLGLCSGLIRAQRTLDERRVRMLGVEMAGVTANIAPDPLAEPMSAMLNQAVHVF